MTKSTAQPWLCCSSKTSFSCPNNSLSIKFRYSSTINGMEGSWRTMAVPVGTAGNQFFQVLAFLCHHNNVSEAAIRPTSSTSFAAAFSTTDNSFRIIGSVKQADSFLRTGGCLGLAFKAWPRSSFTKSNLLEHIIKAAPCFMASMAV